MNMRQTTLEELIEVLAGRRGNPRERAVRFKDLTSQILAIQSIQAEASSLSIRLGLLIDILADPSALPPGSDATLAAIAAARALAGIGGNHVPNSDFPDGLLHWWASAALGSEITWDLRPGGPTWAGPESPVMRIWQNGNAAQTTLVRMIGTNAAGTALRGIHSAPDHWYQVSAKLSSHRCTARLWVRWIDAAGAEISREIVATSTNTPGSSDNPETWAHVGAIVQAPALTAYRQIEMEKLPTDAGQLDSHAFLYQPFSVASLEDAALADYAPGRDMVVAGTRLLAGSVGAAAIDTASFAAAGLDMFDGDIVSDDYDAGVAGWRIAKTGAAEFNNLISRVMLQAGAVSDTQLVQSLAAQTVGTDGTVLLTLALPAASAGEMWDVGFHTRYRRHGIELEPISGENRSRGTGFIIERRIFTGGVWTAWEALLTSDLVYAGSAWTIASGGYQIVGPYTAAEYRIVSQSALDTVALAAAVFTQTNFQQLSITARQVRR